MPPWPGPDAPLERWRSWLAVVWADAVFRRAVSSASRDLDRQVKAIVGGRGSKVRANVAATLRTAPAADRLTSAVRDGQPVACAPMVEDKPAVPPRRSVGRILGGILLIGVAIALLYVGIDAIADPAETVAASSSSRADSETEVQIGGVVLCFFGVTVLGYGIALTVTRGKDSKAAG